jgi:hypothetical protein
MNRLVEPPHVSYWRRALAWAARPRHTYALLVIASAACFVIGIGLIYAPLALILAGAGGTSLGLVGLASVRTNR